MYVSLNWVIIGSGNGLLPVQYQAITWTNAALLSIGLLGTISVKLEPWFYHFHLRKCIWKCCLPKWQPICPGGDELSYYAVILIILCKTALNYWIHTFIIWFIVIQNSILHCSDSDITIIRFWTHKRHLLSHPHVWTVGCVLWEIKLAITEEHFNGEYHSEKISTAFIIYTK